MFTVDVLTGGVVFNYYDADGTDTLTPSDKSFFIGTGIASGVVAFFGEEEATAYAQAGGLPIELPPELGLLFGRTYWYEQ